MRGGAKRIGRDRCASLRSPRPSRARWARSRAFLVRTYANVIASPAFTTTAAPLVPWTTPVNPTATPTAGRAFFITNEKTREADGRTDGRQGVEDAADVAQLPNDGALVVAVELRSDDGRTSAPRWPAARSAVGLARLVERILCGKSRYIHSFHFTSPLNPKKDKRVLFTADWMHVNF
jgi:hypothetical protein